ncbi:hypothetical protein BofuT4_uP015250.1 [Botrytis cinerea T4]|uniref:Uncharacterized protein n=1 Tax=Botryotinia fuckeliana (strain T4) TaxID=999810 RepID=G2YHN2_BOTF4|nr:hypothetical protein BofuT4_uP015250.1 [Botrytis cinerea T4]
MPHAVVDCFDLAYSGIFWHGLTYVPVRFQCNDHLPGRWTLVLFGREFCWWYLTIE